MTPNAERVTFTKKKKTVACPVPLAPLADTHAHLLSFWGKDVPETLVRAKAAGVDLLVTMFDPIADKRSVADYSDWLVREILPMQDIPQIKYLAGVHPYGAPDYTDDVHAQVVAALDDPLCAGIGEIGLDYHMDYDDDIAPAPHNVQIDCMARQLELAVRRNVPVELHLRHEDSDGERTSHVDAYNVLRRWVCPRLVVCCTVLARTAPRWSALWIWAAISPMAVRPPLSATTMCARHLRQLHSIEFCSRRIARIWLRSPSAVLNASPQ